MVINLFLFICELFYTVQYAPPGEIHSVPNSPKSVFLRNQCFKKPQISVLKKQCFKQPQISFLKHDASEFYTFQNIKNKKTYNVSNFISPKNASIFYTYQNAKSKTRFDFFYNILILKTKLMNRKRREEGLTCGLCQLEREPNTKEKEVKMQLWLCVRTMQQKTIKI